MSIIFRVPPYLRASDGVGVGVGVAEGVGVGEGVGVVVGVGVGDGVGVAAGSAQLTRIEKLTSRITNTIRYFFIYFPLLFLLYFYYGIITALLRNYYIFLVST